MIFIKFHINILKYIDKKIFFIIKNFFFSSISKELIASPDLGILDEKDVYDAVIKWVKHDPRERAIHLAGKIGEKKNFFFLFQFVFRFITRS
jgi:hypothetical protein